MAVSEYKKYKVSINPNLGKIQGLKTGDIVRRQYYDGNKIIYSLMCTLDYGEDNITVEEPVKNDKGEISVDSSGAPVTTQVSKKQPWFAGALLEGDAPKTGEMLDFVRITNLFDTDRSGALYLTADDTSAPFMDVIDGIGYNCSLCWPTSIASAESRLSNSKTQYCYKGTPAEIEYIPALNGRERICHFKNGAESNMSFVQTFYEYIDQHKTVQQLSSKNKVVVSYWIKSSVDSTVEVSLGYADESRIDGSLTESIAQEWQYKVHMITVENSGRHLRSLKMDFSSVGNGADVYIADFNIILLSSLANYGDASQIRLGRLSGIVDPVFGKLDGYGGYLQKLYASRSAHISGTLTAGDENGFAATFYAGKIHRNAYIDSLNIYPRAGEIVSDLSAEKITNPTGVGEVCRGVPGITVLAQSSAWLRGAIGSGLKIGKQHCLSFWAYFTAPCTLSVLQDSDTIEAITISEGDTFKWIRHSVVFEIQNPQNEHLYLSFTPVYSTTDDQPKFYFSAPQLESGCQTSQYQPTDSTLNYCDDYGAWFSRGGIGGTIQNPLLRLNVDGEGAIATRNESLRLNQDGSGHVAKGNIRWDENGDVHFSENVKLDWGNLDSSIQDEIGSKSIKILGDNLFMVSGSDTSFISYTPDKIELEVQENNLTEGDIKREWYILRDGEFVSLNGYVGLSQDKKKLTVTPDDKELWSEAQNSILLRCEVTYQGQIYSDAITIRQLSTMGYRIVVTSSNGEVFKNGECDTILRADVYYDWQLVDEDYITDNFEYVWRKYHLPDLENEVEGWATTVDEEGNVSFIDTHNKLLNIQGELNGSDVYMCELITKEGQSFPYQFPINF